MATDPHALFDEWLAEAQLSEPNDPTAMALATADPEGRPSARMVLMKGHDERGFVFYTNLQSQKGRELQVHPQAALLFHWKWLRNQVQVRIEGRVEQVTDREADNYFASRPRMSQIGAWASEQSATLPSRDEFDRRIAEFEARFAGGPVPRPPHWSGFRVMPDRMEFWYGAEYRLHERFLYELAEDGWRKRMLFP